MGIVIKKIQYTFISWTLYLQYGSILPRRVIQTYPWLTLIMMLVSLIFKDYYNFLIHFIMESSLVWSDNKSSGIYICGNLSILDTTSYSNICIIYLYDDTFYTYDNVLKFDPVRDLSPDREIFGSNKGSSNNNNNNNNNHNNHNKKKNNNSNNHHHQ